MPTSKYGEHSRSLMHLEKPRKYDPVKRKEYYERTKKLKGRKKKISKDWIKNTQYDLEKLSKKRTKNHKMLLEDAVDLLGKKRLELKARGLAGSAYDKKLADYQAAVAADYFKDKKGSFGKGRVTTDRYGNSVVLPANVSTKMFSDLKWTARNDLLPSLPDVQNPIKKLNIKKPNIDLQSPIKKWNTDEKPTKLSIEVSPDNKPTEKAPKGYKGLNIPKIDKTSGRVVDKRKSPKKGPWAK